ncbi:response regulator [Paenibacillus mucilaginosus]|uniref:Transcriptional regulatory protein n=1 Tax=Paenibacillus mucilaginosus (strain KNP414) TaxID=1036673 RepID=F8F815_PAEMK|nr:response regulator [Paenibacillus mucilaginosus]AEI41000.1 two-component response regulator [Paenibacillus mucilaginosus KNP414]MCG7211555.1 response regulator [Paenibacillus mucilaginosus]WDM30075.1 response regulator [Paenibacillus mucilaginosus]
MSDEAITVMIVEDDPVAAKIYEQFAAKLGSFRMIATAATGGQALELLQVVTPQLILLDVFLPDMNGMDVLRHVRQHGLKTDVILITAANDTDTVSEAIRGGAYGYIIKPILLDKFTATLEQYAQTRVQLGQRQTMEQHEVDRLFRPAAAAGSGGSGGEQTALPKGIDKLTLKLVRDKLRTLEEPNGADEFAAVAGISHSTVRRYLEYLVSVGEVQVDIVYGTVGRPERKYSRRLP